MNLAELINEDIKICMKNKDSFKLGVIRGIKSAIQLKKIELKHELSDEEVIDIISKQIKMRRDSIKEFEKANRQDLIEQHENEIEILNNYMPKQLEETEVINIIEEAFNKIKPTSVKDMGKIMKEVTPKVKGRYDMSIVSKLIKDKLSNIE